MRYEVCLFKTSSLLAEGCLWHIQETLGSDPKDGVSGLRQVAEIPQPPASHCGNTIENKFFDLLEGIMAVAKESTFTQGSVVCTDVLHFLPVFKS